MASRRWLNQQQPNALQPKDRLPPAAAARSGSRGRSFHGGGEGRRVSKIRDVHSQLAHKILEKIVDGGSLVFFSDIAGLEVTKQALSEMVFSSHTPARAVHRSKSSPLGPVALLATRQREDDADEGTRSEFPLYILEHQCGLSDSLKCW
ncbi:hypothetical protein MRX96_044138 [Rhipicephalus microplus]